MRAAIITGRHEIELRELRDPEPSPGGLVVQVRYCGICGTDVHAYQSGDPYPPGLCGHEWTGVVSAAGRGVTKVREGDRVSVAISPPCGVCTDCRAGHPQWCTTALMAQGGDPLGSTHGAFAPSLAVGADRVIVLPSALSDAAAAQVEPATVAYHAVRHSELRLGDVAVVQGAGPIGLITLQWARLAGAGELIVVEPSVSRRALAVQLGATIVAVPGAEATAVVMDRTGGAGADVVFECVGRPEMIQTAADLVRRGGSLMVIGLSDRDAQIRPINWMMKELSVRCSLAYQHSDFPRVTAMMADGRLDMDALHTRTTGLDDLDTAFRDLAGGAPNDVKILVDPTL